MHKPLSVVFYWHMHQPFYREAESGRYHLPWVYLHAMKDYTDMAMVLEQVPGARAVVNFVPSLTAQIEDYARHLQDWLERGEKLNDPLLAALAESEPFDAATRSYLLGACFRLNHERNLYRYPGYDRLRQLHEQALRLDSLDYLDNGFFTDLVTWYHLGWLAESVRPSNFLARRLIEKGRAYTLADRRDLLRLIAKLLAELPGRYHRLVETSKIELSTTPYAHPILPLMLDFTTAQATVPQATIPAEPYPGGRARAQNHIELAKKSHLASFGDEAKGCWPAEGAVSEEALALLGAGGFHWCATGEAVLRHSLGYNLRDHHSSHGDLYQPWVVGSGEAAITCFFRDDLLSDRIGFEYKSWYTHDAIANFMHELTLIRHRTQGMEAPVVSIIMDGENAWEYFHENGVPFLTGLYQSIAEHPDFELTTYSDYLDRHSANRKLERLVPGSWVYGNFSTWIGDVAKTRGWELLIEAKKAFDRAMAGTALSPEQREAANEQLRICEGSDWCWWFGDYNPGDAVRDFDALYRQHLRKLYLLLGEKVPKELHKSISSGGGHAEGGGTMRRNA